MNPGTWLESVAHDVRYGIRELAKHKGFSIPAALSLALGIMAVTSMYSVIYGIIIEPFPYKDINNLVGIAIRNPEQRGWRTSYSVDEYVELANRSSIFEGVAGSTISDVLWISNGEPLRLRGNHISANGFDVMGVPALFGRTVTANEEALETKAVLGYRCWTNQFGSNIGVIGTTLILNGRPRTVVGVMPPRFMFRGADVYLPLTYRVGETPEGVQNLQVTARRKTGVNNAQAQTDLSPIISDLAQRSPNNYPQKWRVELIPFKELFPSDIRNILWIMFAAVGLLLLIACANVSNLLLARAATRQREMAMRAALGAGRIRLFRQLVTESLLLGIGGGGFGILLSWAGLKAIMAVVPTGVIPDESEVTLNLPVLLFSFAACLGTTVFFGLAPVLHALTSELTHPLKESGRGTGGSRHMAWLRGALVVIELSLSIILLSGAGLFLNTLLRLYRAPLAVEIKDRMVTRLPLSAQRYPTAERRAAFISQLLDNIQTVPGVLGVAINGGVHPLGSWDFPVDIPGAAKQDPRPVNFHQVNAAYLTTTGIKLKQGRFLDTADVASRRQVAAVNETFVKRYFPGQPPLGKRIKLWRLKQPPFALQDDHFEIIGITQNAMHELHNGEPRPELYIPYSMTGLADMLVIHTAGDPMRYANSVRSQVYKLDGSQFLDRTYTLELLMDMNVYSRGKFSLWVMGVFAILGLTLAVIGLFGLLSQIVAQQRQELCVRMAVGAGFGDIVTLVLGRGIRLMLLGLAVGIAATLLLLRRFGIELGVSDPFDPVSLGGACLVLFVTGLAACLLPALRAGRLNPVDAMRTE